ncbi:MAG: hypothetical protein JNM09_22890 [Blastocatellia bacterium]|nr:hypothetical protein [Blastocatellia bacterium]
MKPAKSVNESGYALLSLLVAITIGLVLLASMTAKPSAQFVGQRENEEEAFFRAQQVTYAIQTYATLKGGINNPQNLPTKLEDLLDKFNVQGKEFHILRKSALIDPLTGEEWKPVRWGDPKIKEFARTYTRVIAEQQAQALASGGAGNPAVAGAQQQQGMPPLLMLAAQAAGLNMTNINASDDEEDGKPVTASGFSLDMDSDSRPIVGVISGLKKPMIRNYYTIETYDKAIFIAGVAVPGLNNVMPLGGGMGGIGGIPGAAPGDNDTGGRAPTMTRGPCQRDNSDPRCGGGAVPTPPPNQ